MPLAINWPISNMLRKNEIFSCLFNSVMATFFGAKIESNMQAIFSYVSREIRFFFSNFIHAEDGYVINNPESSSVVYTLGSLIWFNSTFSTGEELHRYVSAPECETVTFACLYFTLIHLIGESSNSCPHVYAWVSLFDTLHIFLFFLENHAILTLSH